MKYRQEIQRQSQRMSSAAARRSQNDTGSARKRLTRAVPHHRQRKDGPSDTYGESTPPSHPADSDAANKGTEEGTPREDSAADGAVTEAAQQGGTGDGHTKEQTPDVAAAMKSATRMLGDSDSSTAVSHTTTSSSFSSASC
ncbi:mucin-associated surface protein (MASP), putative [Trypanosoma cruzi marinkellei]|uniref:Mucin-associated surface protein (MASP), putative n=1 Tax=Trypanosoma cruzi marinkellei TaxID=85056 RepID=K2N2G7_TRYCR|nr:mucin-associated surface protein (MASP), putative [Trypanosoma cruzi marinkellei]